SFLAMLLCGLTPAARLLRAKERLRLMPGSPGTGRTLASARLRSALVIAELSLAMVLLAGAGLMTRTYYAITHVELGFDPSHLLHAQLLVPNGAGPLATKELLSAIRRIPGVIDASLSFENPGLNGGPALNLEIPGRAHAGRWSALLEACDEAY